MTWKSQCVLVEAGVLPVSSLPCPLVWQGAQEGPPVSDGGLLEARSSTLLQPGGSSVGKRHYVATVCQCTHGIFQVVHGTVIFWRTPVAQYLHLQPSTEVLCRGYLELSSCPGSKGAGVGGSCFPGIPPRS